MVFLIKQILKYLPKLIVEFGTASGVSSAAIIYAVILLKESSQTSDFALYSFDLADKCYCNKSLKFGYAVEKMPGTNYNKKSNLIITASVIDFEKYSEQTLNCFILDDGSIPIWLTN